MSLFGSLMRDMERDPIFGAMNQMNQMMNSVFGGRGFGGMPGMGMGMNMLESPFGMGNMQGHPHPDHAHGHGHPGHHGQMFPFGGGMMSPFGGHMGFPDFNNAMMQNDGNSHSFSSMSVTSISSGPDGRPHVYQASNQTAIAPGGVKETRKAVADSRTGTKKMAVGRHVGERAHVREREENLFTGQREENEEFVNLDETEAQTFDREWRQRAYGGRYAHSASAPAIEHHSHNHHHRNGGRHQQQQPQITYHPTRTSESAPSVTIEELPPSDDEEQTQNACPPQAQPAAATASSSRRSPYTRERKPKTKRVKKNH